VNRTVQEWRAEVFRYRTSGTPLSDAARVFLLYLADHMHADRTVKRARRIIARDLGVTPRTITRYVEQATNVGFLSCVQAPKKDRTAAVYQGIFPALGRPGRTSQPRWGERLVGTPWHEPEALGQGHTPAPVTGAGVRFTEQVHTPAPVDPPHLGPPPVHHYLGDHPPNVTSLPSATSTPVDRTLSGGTSADQRAPGTAEVLREGQQRDQDSHHRFDPRSGPIQEQPRPTPAGRR